MSTIEWIVVGQQRVRNRAHWSWASLACWLLVLGSVATGTQSLEAQSPRRGTISLINGDSLQGVVQPGESTDSIAWQGEQFVDPFQLRLGTIRSIKYSPKQDRVEPVGPFSFEFTTGDVVLGKLLGFTDRLVDIDCDSIGAISIRADLLRRLHRIDERASVTFSSLRGLEGWRDDGPSGVGWVVDGDQIWTSQRGATISGDFAVPRRAVVDVELSWSGTPDFAFSIAVDPDPLAEHSRDGWRLETAGKSLAIVREASGVADVDQVADLSNLSRIRLIVYLDQPGKTMEVMRSDGSSLASIALEGDASDRSDAQAAADASSSGEGIRILNRGQSLRLERLHVAKWVGAIPSRDSGGQATIAMADGSVISGQIGRFDPTANQLELSGSSQGQAIDLSNVVAVRFSPTVANVDPGQCALFLHDGMRLSGQLMRIDSQSWTIGGDHYQREIKIPDAAIRTMVVFQNESADVETKPVVGRIGRLEIGSDGSTGRLVEDDGAASPDVLPMRWHPLNSYTSARIRRNVTGKLVYRDPPKIDSESAAARMLAQQRLRNQQQRRGLNFGELFLQRADLSKASPVKRDAHVVHLRSGDVIACRVDSVDEQGVHLSTMSSESGFVPHEKVKAVEFVSNSPPPNMDEAKRERLLTIPRLQKTAPPSHLLCSHNGDFLRCRLLGTQGDLFRVEVQLEELLVPKNRVAQIIWFHAGEWKDAELADEPPTIADSIEGGSTSYEGLVQVVLNDGKRVTFTPTGVSGGAVTGTNPWVGNCQFDLGNVDQLLLGHQIAVEVADVAYNQWKLRPAVEPLVTAAMQGDGATPPGSQSPLVGVPAPEIKLAMINGDTFELSQYQGRIVVLEFWASWSAPCMQTMPQLTEALQEFDPDLVRRISVNLEEPADQAVAALARNGSSVPVALDLDGVAAQKYQTSVIPQVVIVGSDGKVKGLYVGGGAEMIGQIKTGLQELLESTQ